MAAKLAFEHRKIQATKAAHRLYAKLLKFLFGHFAHARQASNRQVFGATPADAVRPNSWRICSRIALAARVAVGRPVLFSVTSRYASSSNSGSTRSVCRLKISRARRETVR